MSMYDICGCGNSLVDEQFSVQPDVIDALGLTCNQMTLADVDTHQKILEGLQKTETQSISDCGGSATNSLVAASTFGLNCFQFVSVADDAAGRVFCDNLTSAGIDFTNVAGDCNDVATGKCVVMVTPDGKRTMSTYLGISSFFDKNKYDGSVLERSKRLYVEGYMVTNPENFDFLLSLLEKASDLGLEKILSLSDPGIVNFFPDQFEAVMNKNIDFIFCNEDEAKALTKTESLDEAEKHFLSYCGQYAITCGEKGAIVHDGEEKTVIPAKSVKVVDTNGAGDMFAGAFMGEIVKGKTFAEAGHFANEAASQCVQHFGPRLPKEQYLNLGA